MNGIEAALAEHAFEHLFIESLGWDRVRANTSVEVRGTVVELTAVAHKRGFTVFLCPTHRTVLANRPLLRDVQRRLRKSHHEHILIYYCETPRKQVWQWATTPAGGSGILHREHPFFSHEPPPRLLERIRGLAVGIEKEEETTFIDVLDRVRVALMPDPELNLFAKYPTYAEQSDRLAMAMKRGEPGAFGTFVELHMPLARKSARMLIRWFGMDREDAEQTAMIGLLEAARRYDPERGYLFSTYAGYWIRSKCQRHGLEWGLPMRMPGHWFWPCYRMQFVEAELIATYGSQAAKERFRQALGDAGVSPKQWTRFCAARQFVCFSDVDEPRRLDGVAASLTAISLNDAHAREVRVDVLRALKALHPRQARILKLRYGIDHGVHTLQEVADKLGVTRERVRQIQARAEEKLSRLLKASDDQNQELPSQPR